MLEINHSFYYLKAPEFVREVEEFVGEWKGCVPTTHSLGGSFQVEETGNTPPVYESVLMCFIMEYGISLLGVRSLKYT